MVSLRRCPSTFHLGPPDQLVSQPGQFLVGLAGKRYGHVPPDRLRAAASAMDRAMETQLGNRTRSRFGHYGTRVSTSPSGL
jgi:hypothetical protein